MKTPWPWPPPDHPLWQLPLPNAGMDFRSSDAKPSDEHTQREESDESRPDAVAD